MTLRIGYLLPTRESIMEGRPEAEPLLGLAERAEQLGYDSVWVGDSLLARPRHEPITLLAGVAGRTRRVKLGTAVLLPALRNPVLLAHQVATLDQVSAGRVILGTKGNDVEETEQNQYSLLETEKKLLGVQHAEIGGRLLARWKFPANLVSAVWFHHQPDGAKGHEKLASFVYLGNMVAHFLGCGFGHQAFALRGRSEALEILQLTPDDLARYMIKTLEKFDEVQRLFGGVDTKKK